MEGTQCCFRRLRVEPVLAELARARALQIEDITIGMRKALLLLRVNTEVLRKLLNDFKDDKPQSMVRQFVKGRIDCWSGSRKKRANSL